MKYAKRLRNGAEYPSSAKMQLEDEDLVMEWAHTLATDYRYIQLTPAKRRNYLLKRLLYDAAMEEFRDKPRAVRLAWAFSRYLQRKEVFLEDDLLAGALQFSDHVYTHPFDEQEELECVMEEAEEAGVACNREEMTLFLRYIQSGFCSKNPGGHVIADYPRLLEKGYGGILREIREHKSGGAFVEAAEISVRAAVNYIRRYAELARKEAAACAGDAGRQRRLERMGETCAWIADKPPRSFLEAVQLILLTHEIAISEQLSGSLSFGRFDAYVTPYYQRDVARGALDETEAYEIIRSFFARVGNNRLAYQNMTLGGWNEQGDGFLPDAVTRMCLRASRELHKDEPMLTFRWNRCMPDSLWEDVVASIRSGTGFPALFNDEVVVAAKQKVGVSKEDAMRYGMIGCVEICAPGKEFSHAEGLRVNWAKMLEVALNGGVDTQTGMALPQKEARPLSSFTTYEAFYRWFLAEFCNTLGHMLDALDVCEAFYPKRWPLPFLSSLMTDCIARETDVTAGGTRYNNTAINHTGMANLADSLQAIRKCVFEQKRFSLEELGRMVAANFEGYENERAALARSVRRYGNGYGDSEAILRDVAQALQAYVAERRNCRGGRYQMGYYSVWAQATFGAQTGALPDGRLAGAPLANSMSPVQGCEKNGPTAVAVSATCLDHTTFGNGMVLDYKFAPAYFDTAAHRAAFRALVEGYFALGGMEMQCNVVDRETLLDAQRRPQEHQDLIVRVSGYSAFFNDLSKSIQDEIIQRTEFR